LKSDSAAVPLRPSVANSVILFALLASVFLSLAQYYFKIASGSADLHHPGALFLQIRLWLGAAFYVVSLYWTMKAYQGGDISFVLPLVSLCDVWNVLLGHFALGEPITTTRVLGIGIILTGITVLTR